MDAAQFQSSQSRPRVPSHEELQDLEKLKSLIEKAIADGKLSQQEMSAIKSQAWADGKLRRKNWSFTQHWFWRRFALANWSGSSEALRRHKGSQSNGNSGINF